MSIASERGKLVFRKMERDLRRIATDLNPDAVHSFRTTSRRLQTLLEELLPERTANQKKLLQRLGRIRKRAGRVRDIDVQLAALRSLKSSQEPRRTTQLMHSLIDLRAKHERKLIKLLKKDDIRDIRKRLRKASKELSYDAVRDPLSVARKIVEPIAVLAARPDEDTLHQSRLAVKRARYAAEFSAQTEESAQFIGQLKKIQDALGRWHDWITLTSIAVDRFGEVHQSSLVAVLQNVTRGKFQQAVDTLSAQLPTPRRANITITPQFSKAQSAA